MLNLNPEFPSRMSQCSRKHQSSSLKNTRNLHFECNLPQLNYTPSRGIPNVNKQKSLQNLKIQDLGKKTMNNCKMKIQESVTKFPSISPTT